MKKTIAFTVAICALSVGGYAFASQLALKTVNIRSTGFSPRTVTVAGGDTVRWRNLDTVTHQVVANNGAFASGQIRPNGSYSRRMDTPGLYPYHDALKPTLRGTVRVTGAAPSVSVGVTAPIVTYGTGIRVTGAISPAAVGDTVVIYGQPYGQASFVELGRVLTTTNGIYDFPHVPQLLTAYKASWKGKDSAIVQTAVSPQLTLTRVGNWFVVRIRAARSFSGRWVYAQRLNQFGQWVSLRKVFFNRQNTQRFKLPMLLRGTNGVRVYLTTNQAGVGYIFSSSRMLTVRR